MISHKIMDSITEIADENGSDIGLQMGWEGGL